MDFSWLDGYLGEWAPDRDSAFEHYDFELQSFLELSGAFNGQNPAMWAVDLLLWGERSPRLYRWLTLPPSFDENQRRARIRIIRLKASSAAANDEASQ